MGAKEKTPCSAVQPGTLSCARGRCQRRWFLNGSLPGTQRTPAAADALTRGSGARTWQGADGVIFPGSHCPVELSACQALNEMQSPARAATWGGDRGGNSEFRRKRSLRGAGAFRRKTGRAQGGTGSGRSLSLFIHFTDRAEWFASQMLREAVEIQSQQKKR